MKSVLIIMPMVNIAKIALISTGKILEYIIIEAQIKDKIKEKKRLARLQQK